MNRNRAQTVAGVPEPPQRRTGVSFATRLLVAQGLVVLAMALTTWLVASAVGPGIFHDHLQQAGVGHSTSETAHVEEAFWSALLISLGFALLGAVAAALAVSAYFSRRVQGSIGDVNEVASQIASGRYASRVGDPGLGEEFATLTDTFNALAERLDAVEATRRRMLSDLAHEMRTPLATIDAHLEAVEDGVRELDRSTLAIIGTSTARLRRLAEDMGAVSSAEEASDLAVDLQNVDAVEVAHVAAAAAMDRYEGRNVALMLDTGSAPIVTVLDPDRIGQVLANLLDNALRHTRPGGSVTLGCRRVVDAVEYTVTDTGEGIAADHLPHLFDRFYRVDAARDRAHGGSGIGLSIVKALVEAHGGTVTATSPGSGQGARFTVRVPTT